MELAELGVWQIPARWSIGRQWLLIILMNSGMLIGGCALLLYPTWQHYQQMMIETEELLQHSLMLTIPPPAGHAQRQQSPPLIPSGSEIQSTHITLPTLLRQISQLSEQQNLSLLSLQQQLTLPPLQEQTDRLPQSIIVEITGAYAGIITFVAALGAASHRLTISEMNLGQRQSTHFLTLRLSLLFYPSPPLAP